MSHKTKVFSSIVFYKKIYDNFINKLSKELNFYI